MRFKNRFRRKLIIILKSEKGKVVKEVSPGEEFEIPDEEVEIIRRLKEMGVLPVGETLKEKVSKIMLLLRNLEERVRRLEETVYG